MFVRYFPILSSKCINFSKASAKLCMSLHYNDGNGYLFVNGKEIFRFKAGNKNDSKVTLNLEAL